MPWYPLNPRGRCSEHTPLFQKWLFSFTESQILKCSLLTWMSVWWADSSHHPLLLLLQLSDHLWLIQLMPCSRGKCLRILHREQKSQNSFPNFFLSLRSLDLERGGFWGSKIKLPISKSTHFTRGESRKQRSLVSTTDCLSSILASCFLTVVLKKTLENLLDYKEIKPVNPKGNQPRIFTGRTDAEAAKVPIL